MNAPSLFSSRQARRRVSSRGAALIIVLSFIVILTLIIVAFLLHSQMSLQIMNARAAQTQVNVMARTVIEFTKGDLRQEIIAGSTNSTIYTVNSIPAYVPVTNATIVPSRTGFTPGTAGSDPMDNIVKISKSGTNFFSGGSYNASYPAANYASAVSTGTPSLNGRHIDSASTGWTTTGWDKPQLVDTTKYGASVLQSIPVPDWIYVTASGRQVLSQPASNVVGRYAYVIYDEGGLLDINVAVYPSSISSPDARDPSRKGPLALADLTQLPGGITSVMQNNIIAWRNQTTTTTSAFSTNSAYSATNYPATNSPPYLKYAFNGSLNRGFTTAYPGDQKFLSRQDLLAYSAAYSTNLPSQSLAYLTTFTRGLNAPTWTPTGTVGNPTGSTFDYTARAEGAAGTGAFTSPWTYNVDSANCRWPATVTITRPKLDADIDCSTNSAVTTVPIETVTFNQGDPVLQHRFPLSKIALLSNPAAQTGVITPPVAGATSGSVAWAVYYYFGLQWVASDTALSEGHWEYAHINAGQISGVTAGRAIASIPDVAAKIDPVTNQHREPDFFEMLRQGILRGSAQDIMILETGASIIDQFDADDVPTAITNATAGSPRMVFGKENLPYFCQMLFWPYRPKSDTTRTTFEAYLVPMFWNPHRNASTISSSINYFQVVLTPGVGSDMPIVQLHGTGAVTGAPSAGPYYANDYYTTGMVSAGTIPFSTSTTATYQEPTIISNGNNTPGFSTTSGGKAPTGGTPAVAGSGAKEARDGRCGFFLGSVTAPDLKETKALGGTGTNMSTLTRAGIIAYGATGTGSITDLGSFNCTVQCATSATGPWHTYEDIGVSTGTPGAHNWLTTDSSGATPVSSSGTVGAALDASPSFAGTQAGNYYGNTSSGPVDPRSTASFGGGGGGIVHTALFSTSISSPAPLGATWQPVASETAASPGCTILSSVSTADFGYFPESDSAHLTSVLIPASPLPNNNYLGMWNENNSTATYNYYQDFTWISNGVGGDNVQRPGDGVYGANPQAADPLATDSNPQKGHSNDRPIILNRPFRSVGELGYVYRGVEWRTLDFCSALSGDAALLDMFSMGNSQKLTALTSSTSSSTALAAGVVNINTRHPEVLQSLLSGSLKNDLDTTASSVISSSQASAIAAGIVAETSSTASGHGPLINRSELATRIMGLSTVTTQLSGTVAKPEREAVVRALAEPADTRTWNLLVDLVVQVGHYPTSVVQAGNAADLSKFYVQGERRYWLHIAIDRYTGKVIDEQLEVVNDN